MLQLKNDYCCGRLRSWSESDDCPFYYNPRYRDYGITAPKSLNKKFKGGWPCYPVSFCPACGTNLPSDLIEEWMEILKNEYNIDDPFDKKQKKLIPKEFKTDEWWKKRGL